MYEEWKIIEPAKKIEKCVVVQYLYIGLALVFWITVNYIYLLIE